MAKFRIDSQYKPSGDQPTAIADLVEGLNSGERSQVLLGVTGSGKTFTMAKVIEATQRPAVILAPNKTLAAQLYSEFKNFFPENAVEYFVSYYDYFQPEAYIPSTDTYIEKDLAINDESFWPVSGSMLYIASISRSKNMMRKHWLPNSPNDAMMSMVSPVTRKVEGINVSSVRV